MQTLREHLKTKQFSNIYLFYGTETFMLETYLKRMTEGILDGIDKSMNFDVFSDKKTPVETIVDGIETLPFLSPGRLVVLERLELFKKGREKEATRITEALENIPEETRVIIIEDETDKRMKLYKFLNKAGVIVEFSPLSEEELIKYIARSLSQENKRIDVSTARYMIHYIGSDLASLNQEIQKLIDFVGDADVIYQKHIDEICQKSVESKIFELVDCMGTNRRARAVKLYHDLIASKEPPTRILYMLTRQFRLNYKAKLYHTHGVTDQIIASKLKVQPFVAKKCLAQARGFKTSELENALNDCLQSELDIKTGIIEPSMGIEMLIIRYSERK